MNGTIFLSYNFPSNPHLHFKKEFVNSSHPSIPGRWPADGLGYLNGRAFGPIRQAQRSLLQQRLKGIQLAQRRLVGVSGKERFALGLSRNGGF